MSELADKLREEFRDKEYRHAYADEFLNSYIATQIKVLREQRGWSQEQLAQEANMKQSRISAIENVHYSSWSLSTLKRLAEAFDVTLRVSFEGFGSRLSEISRFSREALERFSFDEDPVFQQEDAGQLLQTTAARQGLAKVHSTPGIQVLKPSESQWFIFDFDKPESGNLNRYFGTVPQKIIRDAMAASDVMPSLFARPLQDEMQEGLKQVGTR